MSYEKQNWATGDVITAEKLNHMEDGIEDSGAGTENYFVQAQLLYNAQHSVIGCDLLNNGVAVSADDLYNAVQSGKNLVLEYPLQGSIQVGSESENKYAEVLAYSLERGDQNTLNCITYDLLYAGSSTSPIEGAVYVDVVNVSSSNTYTLGGT